MRPVTTFASLKMCYEANTVIILILFFSGGLRPMKVWAGFRVFRFLLRNKAFFWLSEFLHQHYEGPSSALSFCLVISVYAIGNKNDKIQVDLGKFSPYLPHLLTVWLHSATTLSHNQSTTFTKCICNCQSIPVRLCPWALPAGCLFKKKFLLLLLHCPLQYAPDSPIFPAHYFGGDQIDSTHTLEEMALQAPPIPQGRKNWSMVFYGTPRTMIEQSLALNKEHQEVEEVGGCWTVFQPPFPHPR